VPAWAQQLSPGALDRRVLDQSRIWVTAEARVVFLADMSTAHLRAVIEMLTVRAVEFHAAAVLDALYALVLADLTGEAAGEWLARAFGGPSVAALDPVTWLETTALVRALRRELASRRPR